MVKENLPTLGRNNHKSAAILAPYKITKKKINFPKNDECEIARLEICLDHEAKILGMISDLFILNRTSPLLCEQAVFFMNNW